MPLIIVVGVSVFIEAKEDIKRHKADNEINNRVCRVLQEADFMDINESLRSWKDVRVGEIVRVDNRSEIPADLILLST